MIANSRIATRLAVLCLALTAGAVAARAQQHVADTAHNLSVSGPGTIRAQSEQEICVFCHAPHSTNGASPLWNRNLALSNYTIYQSSTLNAQPGQPTGSSKLCLSCHDGTIALGNVLSRTSAIAMLNGTTLPAGLKNLGTDLSDDHPISFSYTASLATVDQQLKSPSALPFETKLDSSGQLQCTTCHDPHSNVNGSFLVLSRQSGQLCNACHQMTAYAQSSHATSVASTAGATGQTLPYPTVAQNSCRSCHRSHSAGGRQRLLLSATEEDNCLDCHSGQVASRNILAELSKSTHHDARHWVGRHDPLETGGGALPHAECQDCHQAHRVQAPSFPAGTLPYVAIGNTLSGARGTSITGTPVASATYEYEVCLRCHGDNAVATTQHLARQAETTNLRLKFATGNPSFHPLAAPSVNTNVPSLKAGITHGQRMRCTDCHNNNATRRKGGTGPDGPHGSTYAFLLQSNYGVTSPGTESATQYALCYQCHDRTNILSNAGWQYHNKHIVEEHSACSDCHDPHGVSVVTPDGSSHTHLINFRTTVVTNSGLGYVRFTDTGTRHGSCTLRCHGEDHRNESY